MLVLLGSRYTSTDDIPTQVTLEPASYTEEKFALYSSYQKEVHREIWDRQPSGFERFLVKNPLVVRTLALRGELT